MPGLLRNTPISDAERQNNDQHRPGIVIAVVALLCLYIYLFTLAADPLGLPLPKGLADTLGVSIEHVFDSDGNVDSNFVISLTQRFDRNDDERLIFFCCLIAAFLSAYYLPLPYKQLSLILWTVAAIIVLYGAVATAGLLFAHFVVYLVLHPKQAQPWIPAVVGLLASFAFVHDGGAAKIVSFVLLPLLSLGGYHFLVLRLFAKGFGLDIPA